MTVLLRTAEVSDQTGIPVATLRWRPRGKGPPSFKLGRKPWYIPLTHWQVWIGNHSAVSMKGNAL
jgi:hypothetical protein